MALAIQPTRIIKKPRPEYQEPALNKIWEHVHKNPGSNPLVSLCVGAGKTLIIAWLCQKFKDEYPKMKILVAVHNKELIEQNYEELKDVAPGLDIGLYAASTGQKRKGKDVTFALIQSIHRKPEEFTDIDLMIIDECHLISKRQSNGMYRTFIEAVQSVHKGFIVVGLTGTPWRMDGGPLHYGEGRLFDDLIYEVSIRNLLDLGYLCPLTTPDGDIQNKFTLSQDIKRNKQGEASEKDQAMAFDADPDKIDNAIDEYYRLSKGRVKHLIFGTTIEHCEHLKQSASRYFKVDFIHGSMKKKDRERAIERFKYPERFPEDEQLDMLVSGIILTTGFNVPQTDCIGLFRDVGSSALYLQIAGRGLRLSEGKENCLWLDFTETTERHGPVDQVEPPPPPEDRKSAGKRDHKVCPQCKSNGMDTVVPLAATECPECGYMFERNMLTPSHDERVSGARVLSTERKKPYWVAVKGCIPTIGVPLKQRGTQNPSEYLKLEFVPEVEEAENIPIFLSLEGSGRHYACNTWEKIVKEEYSHSCPSMSRAACDMIKNGALKDYNEILIDDNDKSEYYLSRSGKKVKRKDGAIGYKLLDLRWR